MVEGRGPKPLFEEQMSVQIRMLERCSIIDVAGCDRATVTVEAAALRHERT